MMNDSGPPHDRGGPHRGFDEFAGRDSRDTARDRPSDFAGRDRGPDRGPDRMMGDRGPPERGGGPDRGGGAPERGTRACT